MARTSIQADLGLDTTRFQRGLAKSKKGIGKFVSNGIKQFGALAGAAGFGMLARSAFEMATNISNLSKVANSGQEEFQRFAFGAKTVGVEMDKTADILKDVSDKVGDFLQTGGGPLADFFENIAPKVGVTAEMFRDLSGPEALQLYVSSLEKANLSQNEMTFFMEAIASDATLLLPLLRDNGQAMTELGKEAEELGVIMKTSTVEQLTAASVEINKFKTSATVLTGEIISKVVPAFGIFGDGLGGVGDIIGGIIGKFASFFTFLSRSLGIVIAPAVKAFAALSAGIEGAIQAASLNPEQAKAAIEKSTRLAKEAFETLKDIPDEMAANYKHANADMEMVNKSVERSMKERADSIEKNWKLMTTGMVVESKDAAAKIEDALGGDAPDQDGGGGEKTLAEKIQQIKLAVLRAEASGNSEAEESLKRRLALAEEILAIMNATGASQEEATGLAGSTGERGGGIKTGKIGGGPSQSFRDRERAAGLYNTTLGRDGAKLDDMVGGKNNEAKADPAMTERQKQTNSLKSIERELTATQR